MRIPRSRHALALFALCTLACAGIAGDPDAERAAKEQAAATKAAKDAAATAEAQTEAVNAKWRSDMAIAAAIGSRHYLPVLQAGQPYTVANPEGGDPIALGAPEVVPEEGGHPRVYPTSATEGHAIGTAKTADGTAQVFLDYTVVWDPELQTGNGKGAFLVKQFEVLRIGTTEDERFSYTKSGDYFTRQAN